MPRIPSNKHFYINFTSQIYEKNPPRYCWNDRHTQTSKKKMENNKENAGKKIPKRTQKHNNGC